MLTPYQQCVLGELYRDRVRKDVNNEVQYILEESAASPVCSRKLNTIGSRHVL